MRGPWRSVRARTTVLATVVVGGTLLVAAVVLVVTLDRSLTRSGDDLAVSRAHDLAALAQAGELPRVLLNIDPEGVAQVVDEAGGVLAASPNIQGADPISRFHPAGRAPVVLTVDNAPDDNETETYRVWALAGEDRSGPFTVYVGGSLESVDEATRTLRRSLFVGVPVVLALLAFCTWVLIGRALRPVESIRAEVATISDQGLGRRVPVPGTDDEVGRLATTMNEMLERLESASRRQREFVSDASHELQSPLAAFRAQLEVALTHPAGADWELTGMNLLSDTDRMERLVRDLLFLAREQANGVPPENEHVDLDDIVLEEAARSRKASPSLRIDTAAVSGAPVLGSPDDLRRLVRNLLDNAVKHAVSSVHLAVSCDDEVARLDVTDDGPGVQEADLERVFDRFYRGDSSRARSSGGAGLGLAIARAVAERHGGGLEVARSDRGAHFVLLLPVQGAPRPSARSRTFDPDV